MPRKRNDPSQNDPGLLPEIYQQALAESVQALEIVTQVIQRNIAREDVGPLLDRVRADHNDIFLDKLTELIRQTSGLLLVSRRMSESLSLDVLLPRMVELISEFLDAERCTIFLYDGETDELFTRAAVGLDSEIRMPSDHGIVGAVFQSGEPQIVHDPYADPRFNPEVDRQTGFRTRNLICVPLRHTSDGQTRTVGAVQVLNRKSGSFGEHDLRLLDSLNSQASAAFVNAILHEEIRRGQAQESRLLEISTALATELKLEPLLVKIMDAAARLLSAERATLFLHDGRTNELWALVGDPAAPQEIRFPSHEGIAGHVFGTGETVNLADAYADPRFNREADRRTGYRTRSLLCMPVVSRSGDVIGVTQVLNKKRGRFGPHDERRLAAFSAQASVALQNSQLFKEVDQVRRFNESILESITNGIVTVTADGRVTRANTAALRLLGRVGTPDAATGQSVRVLFRGPNAWVADSVADVLRTGAPSVAMDRDLSTVAAGGDAPTSVNLAAHPFTDVRTADRGCLLMIEDVTREKRIRGALSRFMNKQVADRLIEQGDAALEGRLQRATVLFSDLRSFTAISERIGAQATVRLLNDYFALMADIILDRGGLLDKYIGDAIMAVFGVPVTGTRDADVAVGAAIEMFRALRDFNATRAAAGDDPVGMGIGLNTDEIVSGNIGSAKRMDYTVIGDGVNLAARLEKANRAYGTQLLLSEFTARELKDSYTLREVDRLRVKGKVQPVRVLEVLDHLEEGHPVRQPRFLSQYHRSLGLYQKREWAPAREGFEAALVLHPGDAPARLYAKRCARFVDSPPANDWDGISEGEGS